MKKTVTQAKNSKVIRQDFGVAEDHDSLPELTISEEQLEAAHEAVFGREDEIKIVPLTTSMIRIGPTNLSSSTGNELSMCAPTKHFCSGSSTITRLT